jgi:hypothetical protein
MVTSIQYKRTAVKIIDLTGGLEFDPYFFVHMVPAFPLKQRLV